MNAEARLLTSIPALVAALVLSCLRVMVEPLWERRMATGRRGHLNLVLKLSTCAVFLGCADGQGPAAVPVDGPQTRSPLPALIVSNPAVLGLSVSAGSQASLADAVVYASLPTGSVPEGEFVRFTNMATDAEITVTFVDGGFDPVPIPAVAGDSLRVEVQYAGDASPRLFQAKVPPRRAPIVVRSDPPARRSDVPLNARILVVFSEPMSGSAIGESAVVMTLAGQRVPATLAFADSAHVSVALTPNTPLDPGATYTLRISAALTDGDGEAVGVPASIQFTTQAVGGGTPVGTAGALDASFERTVPHVSGYYRQSEFILRADGTFALHYFDPGLQPADLYYLGTYVLADSVASLEFRDNAGHPMGSWAATATLRDGLLQVRFNLHAQLDDFEDGDYRHRPVGGIAPGGITDSGTLRVVVTASGLSGPSSIHGRLSGESIRSVVDGTLVDDHPTFFIGTNDLQLAPGRYVLALEPPANCTSSAAVELDIAAGAKTTTEVAITCEASAWLAVRHVVVSESGPTLTRIIYVCDGDRCTDYWPTSTGPISIRVAPGQYQIRFLGYPNCRDTPEGGVSVNVAPGDNRALTLRVTCDP
jgi:hypothetical protein